jgi:hypothetical protein
MSVPLTVGGVTFQYPQQFDRNWGPTLTGWSTAVTNVLALFSAGTFTVLKSDAANIAQSGLIRLANNSTGIGWRNFLNSADLLLTVNASNQLTFNGTPIGATTALTDGHILVGDALNQPADVAMTGDITISDTGVTTLGALKVSDLNIATLAGIAFTKLASTTPYFWYTADSAGVLSPIGVTASRAVVTDANGLPSASTVTPTELGYVSGVTSPIQTQLSGITSSFLPLSGGTMSGNISMASNKITALANGTATGDALSFAQNKVIQWKFFANSVNFSTTSNAFQATNLSGSITPTSASNSVLIITMGTCLTQNSGATALTNIQRGPSTLLLGTSGEETTAGASIATTSTLLYVDAPATASAITYTVMLSSADGANTVKYGNGLMTTMLLVELAV